MKVKLDELAEAMAKSDVCQGYVDIEKGKVILLRDDMGEEDALNHAFDIEEDWEHYIPLPNVIDECERDMMKSFAAAQSREETRERLADILAGAGAAARFHRQVRHLLLEPAWKKYQKAYLHDVAKDWCEENRIPYEE